MNNLSPSVGTESQYSATSSQRFEENAFKQEGGGIFSFLFGSEKGAYATELALRAFNDKVPQISCYIIKDSLNQDNNIALDYSKQDSHKRTLLHFLVLYSAYFPDTKELLLNILKSTDAKKHLNLQDDKNNTCVHYAMYLEMEDIVKLLADYDADLLIKNNQGYYIRLEQVPVKTEPSDIFVKITKKSCDKTKELSSDKRSSYTDSVNNRLDSIVQAFVNAKSRMDSDVDTIGFNRSQMTDGSTAYENDNHATRLSDKLNRDLDTDEVMNIILREFESDKPGQRGGAKKKTTRAKKNGKVTGKRRMITYSEMSFGGGSSASATSDDDSDSETNDALRDMARAVNNKASEAHTNAIVRIKEIMKLEDEEARAVKAILYDKIKKEKGELTNLDKAIELEKMASDESVLKTIKKSAIKKMVELIKTKHSEKEMSTTSSEKTSDKSNKRNRARVLPYESLTTDDSSSSDSEEEKKSKKILELTDDSSTSSDSSVVLSIMS